MTLNCIIARQQADPKGTRACNEARGNKRKEIEGGPALGEEWVLKADTLADLERGWLGDSITV